MTRIPATLEPPAPRLLSAAAERSRAEARETLVVAAGVASGEPHWSALLATAPAARLLVLSALGAHPDASTPRLRRLWALEEAARGSGRAVLTLRLAPLLGASSPLWLQLRTRPRLPGRGRALLQPVVEEDAVETVARALDGRAAWEGWYEVTGTEPFTLDELAALAGRTDRLPPGSGCWEPPVEELRENRLAEPGPWSAHFGLEPRAVSRLAASWS